MQDIETALEKLPDGIFIGDDGVYIIKDGIVTKGTFESDGPTANLIGGHVDPK